MISLIDKKNQNETNQRLEVDDTNMTRTNIPLGLTDDQIQILTQQLHMLQNDIVRQRNHDVMMNQNFQNCCGVCTVFCLMCLFMWFFLSAAEVR